MAYTSPFAVCDALTHCEPVHEGAVQAGPEGDAYVVRVAGVVVLAWCAEQGWQALTGAVERAGVVVLAVGLMHARGQAVRMVSHVAGL